MENFTLHNGDTDMPMVVVPSKAVVVGILTTLTDHDTDDSHHLSICVFSRLDKILA